MFNSNSIATFARGVLPVVELKNFWPPEDGFVWSAGKWCELHFQYDIQKAQPNESAELVIDIDAFRSPSALEAQNVFFYLNGLRIGARRLNKRVTAFIEFDPAILKPTSVLTLDTPDAATPVSFNGNDERMLGVQLFSFQVRYFANDLS